MNPDVVTALLVWISLVIAFVAAGLWLKASKTIVRDGDPKSRGSVFKNGIDVQSTASEQSRWNSWAATATAIALLVQATSQAISHWGFIRDLVASG